MRLIPQSIHQTCVALAFMALLLHGCTSPPDSGGTNPAPTTTPTPQRRPISGAKDLKAYEAEVAGIIRKAWNEECVRHRDRIRPGYLTVSFHIKPSGETGDIRPRVPDPNLDFQGAFTAAVIKNAQLPAIPESIRISQQGKPLELIFNFYF